MKWLFEDVSSIVAVGFLRKPNFLCFFLFYSFLEMNDNAFLVHLRLNLILLLKLILHIFSLLSSTFYLFHTYTGTLIIIFVLICWSKGL